MSETKYIDVGFDKPNIIPQAHSRSQRRIDVRSALCRTKDFPGRRVHGPLTDLSSHVLCELADIGIVNWCQQFGIVLHGE